MLAIHILNAGHGDSIVIEYQGDGDPAYAVIDSNRESGQTPPALIKLRQLGAERLSFVALTHPHADHYKGLLDILEEYRGCIDNFYSFPLDHNKEGRLDNLIKIYMELFSESDGVTIRSSLSEYLKIIYEVKKNIGLDRWEEHGGLENAIAPTGFAGVEIHSILPMKSVKGDYFQLIEKQSPDVVENPDLNDLSLAYQITYKGRRLILGGDAPYLSWVEHKRGNKRREQEINADLAKLPHHGSDKDCKQEIIDYIFTPDGDRFACISANGRSHPHKNTLMALKKQNVMPYCTNLAIDCGAAARKSVLYDNSLKPDLALFLNRALEEIPGQRYQPCQGNISIIIDDTGNLSIETEHGLPCPYRGDYDSISGV